MIWHEGDVWEPSYPVFDMLEAFKRYACIFLADLKIISNGGVAQRSQQSRVACLPSSLSLVQDPAHQPQRFEALSPAIQNSVTRTDCSLR